MQQSIRRVQRGCLFIGLILIALAVLFTSATGNLFYLTLGLVAVLLVVASRFIR